MVAGGWPVGLEREREEPRWRSRDGVEAHGRLVRVFFIRLSFFTSGLYKKHVFKN